MGRDCHGPFNKIKRSEVAFLLRPFTQALLVLDLSCHCDLAKRYRLPNAGRPN
jgi:hypothetical protein